MRILYIIIFSVLVFHNTNAQVTFTSSNLPIVKLYSLGNTIQQSPPILGGITITNNASGVNLVTDLPNDVKSLTTINIRGSTSAGFDQKSYSLELRDSTNSSVDVKKSVLGMPAESDWILYGPYTDKTFLRNVLTYTIGTEMSEYAPRGKFVELMIDSVYQGVYVLFEKIKRDANRVNIAKLLPTDNVAPGVTGGYLLKIDKFTGVFNGGFEPSSITSYQGVPTNYYFQFEYPKNPTQAQFNYIQNYVDSFEVALTGSNFKDSLTGYRKYINVKSFIHYFLSNELSNNVDGYRLSTYLYKKKITNGDGKIHMGPLWDFNLAFVNANYCDGFRFDVWAYEQPCNQPDIPFWWRRLLQDSNYTQELKCRYTYLRNTSLSNARIEFLIDSMVNYIGPSATARHYTQYPILGVGVWPNYYVGSTYTEEIDTLKSWINQRLAWLDVNMPGNILPGCLQAPLSITPILLTAQSYQNSVTLNWNIHNSTSDGYFLIERSSDALHFEVIGTIVSDENLNNYSFIDYEPKLGINYYRIRYINSASANKESNIVQAEITNDDQLNTSSYVVQDNLELKINALKYSNIIIDIMDLNGSIIQRKTEVIIAGENRLNIPTTALAAGTYFVRLTGGNKYQPIIKRFVKM
jgi:hypothetical protein